MGDVATLAGAGGLGVLAIVIGYLLVSNRTDRKEYQEAIDRAEKRADEAEKRRLAAEKRAEERADGLQTALDEVRTARRRAEDLADEYARQLERYRPRPGGGR